MKWIDVNERNPHGNLTDVYHVKVKYIDMDESVLMPSACTFSGEWETKENVEVVQWLDESTPADDWVKEVRAAFAAYHQTEGCSCCQDIEGHKEAENKLIKLLKPAMYSDNSGADWGQYITT